MDSDLIKITALCLVFGTGITIPVSIAWLEHRTRKRGLDTLRIYAERGEEPPASVIEAVTKVTNVWGNQPHPWGNPPDPRPPQTRGITWPMPPPARSSPPVWRGSCGGVCRHSAKKALGLSSPSSWRCSLPAVSQRGWFTLTTRPTNES